MRFSETVYPAKGRSHYIFEHSHALERLHHLKGATDTQVADLVGLHAFDALALEKNISGGKGEVLIDEVEDGGLTGAIGADEAKNLSLLHLETHTAHCHEPAEPFTDLFHFKEIHWSHPAFIGS